MKILFLTLLDINMLSNSNLYEDLMRAFMNNKHIIYIVSPTEKRNNQSTEYLVKEKYSILKVKTGNIQKTNRIEKGISTLLIEAQFKSAII